ncbi:MAG: hypothetical protein LBQ77_03915 [Treponema sp.]|jgi:hypothetical protein|nr:hypothetical protein [Treponema sp.]
MKNLVKTFSFVVVFGLFLNGCTFVEPEPGWVDEPTPTDVSSSSITVWNDNKQGLTLYAINIYRSNDGEPGTWVNGGNVIKGADPKNISADSIADYPVDVGLYIVKITLFDTDYQTDEEVVVARDNTNVTLRVSKHFLKEIKAEDTGGE